MTTRTETTIREQSIAPTPAITGWSAWKNGRIYDASLHPTKRDILIGYDMMPLRGLRNTEKVLASKGIMILRTRIAVCRRSQRDGFCLSVDGRLDSGSLGWSIMHDGGGVWKVHDPRGHETLTFVSACGYVASRAEDGVLPMSTLEPEESLTLKRLWWGYWELDRADPSQPRDKRRRSSLEKAWAGARATFERVRISLVPVKFSLEV